MYHSVMPYQMGSRYVLGLFPAAVVTLYRRIAAVTDARSRSA